MKRLAKTFLIVAFSAAAGVLFGVMGLGSSFEAHVVGPTRAVVLVSILEDLRAGKNQDAIDSLEWLLDSSLLEAAVVPSYGVFHDSPAAMRHVAIYRETYPSPVRKNGPFIKRALARYKADATAASAPPTTR